MEVNRSRLLELLSRALLQLEIDLEAQRKLQARYLESARVRLNEKARRSAWNRFKHHFLHTPYPEWGDTAVHEHLRRTELAYVTLTVTIQEDEQLQKDWKQLQQGLFRHTIEQYVLVDSEYRTLCELAGVVAR